MFLSGSPSYGTQLLQLQYRTLTRKYYRFSTNSFDKRTFAQKKYGTIHGPIDLSKMS